MPGLNPEVKDIVSKAVEGLIPVPVVTHPLGRHRRPQPRGGWSRCSAHEPC